MDTTGFVDPASPEAMVDLSEENKQLRQQIGFGMDMNEFMRSDVGKLLQHRANAEIKNFRAEFDDLDLTTAEGVAAARQIQQNIAVRKLWREWIEIAIHEGEAAQATALERGEL
jgi:muconolactone delta-isomerase